MPFEQECINFIPYLALSQTVAFLILKYVLVIPPCCFIIFASVDFHVPCAKSERRERNRS